MRETESVANVNKTRTSKERKTSLKFNREIFVRTLLHNLILNRETHEKNGGGINLYLELS